MTLAPEVWGRLVEDERTQDLVVPFIGFFESDDPEFEPPDDIAERLDQAATAIPTVILVLRKLAKRFRQNSRRLQGQLFSLRCS
jgi:hypothetical protein